MGLPRTQTLVTLQIIPNSKYNSLANNPIMEIKVLITFFLPKRPIIFWEIFYFALFVLFFTHYYYMYVCINPSYLVIMLFRNDSISFGFGSKSQMKRIKKIIFSRECYLFAMILMLL